MLELKLAKPVDFEFKSGQFVQLYVPEGSGQSILRSYSLASPPQTAELLLCVKLVPHGKGSTYIANLAVGEDVTVRGPEGRFVVAPEHSAQKTFVATGAGIAPIISMLEDEVTKPYNERLQLIFGVRSVSDVFWKERLECLAKKYSLFSYCITLSQPSGDWAGGRGRVTEHIAQFAPAGNWYLCGSLPMVKDVRVLLTAQGVATKQIHFEIF